MGTTYTLMMYEDHDWSWVGGDKEVHLKRFEEEFIKLPNGYPIERVGEWFGYVIYDIDKQYPEMDYRKDLIKKFSDMAWYNMDTSPWKWLEIRQG